MATAEGSDSEAIKKQYDLILVNSQSLAVMLGLLSSGAFCLAPLPLGLTKVVNHKVHNATIKILRVKVTGIIFLSNKYFLFSESGVPVFRHDLIIFVLSTENYGESSRAVSGDELGMNSDPSVLIKGKQFT